jgi:predicted DNA-binding transcriptional regulator YafY
VPKKQNPDATPSMKVLAVYWLLLFSGRPWSLTELADRLECAKQTVIRIMDQIDLSGYAPLDSWIGKEDGRRYYQLLKPDKKPSVALSAEDIHTLLLCRDVAWGLLPDSLRETVGRSLGHATVLLPDFGQRAQLPADAACQPPKGGVSYPDDGEVMACPLAAMRENRVCELEYRAIDADRPKVHRVAPRRLIPSQNAFYLTGWLLKDPDTVYQTTLAVQRIARAELTGEIYDQPWPSDEPQGFGIMKEEPFRVKASFEPLAACYVSERVWSQDQVLEPRDDGGVILTFTATSKPEVIS